MQLTKTFFWIALAVPALADLTFYVPADSVLGIDGEELSLVAHANLNDQFFFDVQSIYVGTGGFPITHAYELAGTEGQAGELQSFTLACSGGEISLEVPSQDSLFWGGPFSLPMPGEILTMPAALNCTQSAVGEAVTPESIDLLDARPNPFNPATTLTFVLDKQELVELGVYNLAGEQVSKLAGSLLPAGKHSLHFYAANLPSGLYLGRLSAGHQHAVVKLLLLR
jgi:hypothetical protein